MKDGPLLICYDGSPGARRAIEAAAEVLKPRLAIVLNVQPVLTAAESYAAMASPIPGGEFEQVNWSAGLERADEGANLARAVGFDAEPRSALAEPTWQGIVDVADEVDALAIVIGSRGLTGIRERFEGSLSHQVAEHSGRLVLVVPPPHSR